ncbi:MAG: transporter substrate-binding domain-containing protein [Candidatus Thiodiazotropha sp. (ex Dulcina madagascariensis)]|nr:transporter substrate-binding domain-containing protein [Candidatus Thiodiazotropha sp. (ex Dulcina madagascariensis)]
MLIASVYPTRLIAGERLPIATFAFPPCNYFENGRIVGSEIDVVWKVFQRMGYELDVQLLPIGRAYLDTAEGRFVAIIALSETPERFSTFYHSEPVGLTRRYGPGT